MRGPSERIVTSPGTPRCPHLLRLTGISPGSAFCGEERLFDSCPPFAAPPAVPEPAAAGRGAPDVLRAAPAALE